MSKRAVALLLVTTAWTAAAQGMLTPRPAVVSDSVPLTLEAAHAEGARFPRPGPPNNPSAFTQEVSGYQQRQCVDVTDLPVARSGDFVAGAFASYNAVWPQGYGKIWWSPQHISDPAPTLVVRVARLDGAPNPHVFEQPFRTRSRLAAPDTGYTNFYPSGMHLPSVGRWLMVATAGANWGCFVLTVQPGAGERRL